VKNINSIILKNYFVRFLSGSRDGMAMIWSFTNGEWQSKCLDSTKPLGNSSQDASDPKNRLKVTMVW